MRAVLRMQLIVERMCCEYHCGTVAPGAEVHYRGQTGATSRKDCTQLQSERVGAARGPAAGDQYVGTRGPIRVVYSTPLLA